MSADNHNTHTLSEMRAPVYLLSESSVPEMDVKS